MPARSICPVHQNSKQIQGPIRPINEYSVVPNKSKIYPLEQAKKNMDWQALPMTENPQLIDMKWNGMAEKMEKKNIRFGSPNNLESKETENEIKIFQN